MSSTLRAIAACGVLTVSAAAYAGPCDMKDAGSGPTPGANAGMTTGATKAEHPPTAVGNKQLDNRAASPADVRDQTAGKPTAAQQAEGKKAPDC